MEQVAAYASGKQPVMMMRSDAEIAQMGLSSLVSYCINERNLYRRMRQQDTRYAFELFRRALVERDQLAWEQVYIQYHALVECWVKRCSAFIHCEESCEAFASEAFTRLYRVITPERFAGFPNMAALLRYLHRCTESVVLDSVRSQRFAESLPEEALLEGSEHLQQSSEDVDSRLERQEFWRTIMMHLHDEAERVVVLRSFMLGLRPNDIYHERRDLFANVNEVYSIKRNVLVRLRRNPQLQHLCN